jgi:hypothetical protein
VQVSDAIEGLDKEHLCKRYWEGKAVLAKHAAGLPVKPANRQPGSEMSTERGQVVLEEDQVTPHGN